MGNAEYLTISRRISIPHQELSWEYLRSGGPGGQNVNKVNSRVRLSWNVLESLSLPDDVKNRFQQRYASRMTQQGILIVGSQRYRDQPRNKQDCLDKLTEMLKTVLRPQKTRKPTRPTKGSKERRLTEKKQRSERKSSRGWRGE